VEPPPDEEVEDLSRQNVRFSTKQVGDLFRAGFRMLGKDRVGARVLDDLEA
jgi:hypothetical protein